MSRETKPTNPKDAIGSKKLPLDLVPDTAVAEMATSFLEGALKYGKFNWRIDGVRASIYIAAARRHLAKFTNGEDEDQVTRVKHLASVMACCAIILDANVCGKLVDDRPPRTQVSNQIDDLSDKVAHLQELFKDHNPHQNTIADSPKDDTPVCVCNGNGCSACGGWPTSSECEDCGIPLHSNIQHSDYHRLCRKCGTIRNYNERNSKR